MVKMELIITLVKENESKIVSYLVPDEVVHIWSHVCERYNRDGWYVFAADEISYYLETKVK